MSEGVHATDPGEPGWWRKWGDAEPIRRAAWPVAVAIVALLGGYGVLTDERGLLWLGVVAAVLSAGGAELARLRAFAPATVAEGDLDWLEYVEKWREYEYERGLADAAAAHDAPGDHAAPEPPPEAAPTAEIRAVRPSPRRRA